MAEYDKDSQEIQSQIQRLREFNTKWQRIYIQPNPGIDINSPFMLENVFLIRTEEIMKLAETKEQYLNRRKILAKIVKSFVELLSEDDSLNVSLLLYN